MIKTINLISLLLLHFYKESMMCGSLPTHLISSLSPGVLMLHVKPDSRLKCQPQRGKMLLGTFKTVFNSVFLVPTKTNTPHHMAKMERCSALQSWRGRWRGRDRQILWRLDWFGFAQQEAEQEGSVDWSVIGQSVFQFVHLISPLV